MIEATAVIFNAHVLTLNPRQPTAEAIAIYENKIVAVGSKKHIEEYVGKKTRMIDARKSTVVPGLNDCHAHMFSYGQFLQTLDLRNTKSITELQSKLRSYAKRNPERKWILGGRWDQEKFIEKRYPTRQDLDEAVSDRPVFLIRVCGHIGVINSRALQKARKTDKTQAKDEKTRLSLSAEEHNGLLTENALRLIWKAVPKPTPAELEQTCLLASKRAVEAGLTCVHWIAGSSKEITVLQRLHSENRLPLRVYLGIPAESLDLLSKLGLQTGFGNEYLKIGFAKILADGSLGARTASLEEPYSDKSDARGQMLYKEEELEELVMKSHNAGIQLAVHAIGDHALRVVLNAFERALKKYPMKNHRHRVEHASVLNPGLIRRMRRLGLVASVQPHFVASDFWLADRLGIKRARWAYPFKTLIQEDLTVCSGSDCPVEPISPVLGIWAAVSRENSPNQDLSVEEALETYTSNSAYASFDEGKRGRIEPGKLADLTLLSEDPFSVSPDDIKLIKVRMTIVNGRVVYSNIRPKS